MRECTAPTTSPASESPASARCRRSTATQPGAPPNGAREASYNSRSMPDEAHTLPRDHLDWLFKLARRAARRWWLAAAVTVLGAAVTIVVVRTRPLEYLSQAVVYYQ